MEGRLFGKVNEMTDEGLGFIISGVCCRTAFKGREN